MVCGLSGAVFVGNLYSMSVMRVEDIQGRKINSFYSFSDNIFYFFKNTLEEFIIFICDFST